jgi:hypothetical protein
MRLRARAQAATQWLIWHQAVAGTQPAQPFWAFAQRHRDEPRQMYSRANPGLLRRRVLLANRSMACDH